MAWRRIGDTPLSEPLLTWLTNICGARGGWANILTSPWQLSSFDYLILHLWIHQTFICLMVTTVYKTWDRFNVKIPSYYCRIPIIVIRWCHNRLISVTEIPIHGKPMFILKRGSVYLRFMQNKFPILIVSIHSGLNKMTYCCATDFQEHLFNTKNCVFKSVFIERYF